MQYQASQYTEGIVSAVALVIELHELTDRLDDRMVEQMIAAGIGTDRLVVDPGIGFGKRLEHNLALLSRLSAFRRLGVPVLIGISRKSMLGQLTGRPVEERLAAAQPHHAEAGRRREEAAELVADPRVDVQGLGDRVVARAGEALGEGRALNVADRRDEIGQVLDEGNPGPKEDEVVGVAVLGVLDLDAAGPC